jgi:hypothetical protein
LAGSTGIKRDEVAWAAGLAAGHPTSSRFIPPDPARSNYTSCDTETHNPRLLGCAGIVASATISVSCALRQLC